MTKKMIVPSEVLETIESLSFLKGNAGYPWIESAILVGTPQHEVIEVREIINYLSQRLKEWEDLGERRFEPANMWGYNFIMKCFDDLEEARKGET